VTVVVPTDARGPAGAPLVTQCLRSLVERTACDDYDILVADNGRLPDSALEWLARRASRRISYQWAGPFNFSRKLNFAVAHAASPYVVLLNDDVEVISPDWLDAMLEYALQPEIGAVGAKLFYPDGRLQHVGVVTGVCGVAAHLLHQHPGTSMGCGGLAALPRNCTAVTGACLLTRRELYDAVGGFDEQLVVDFNDVDYCLKLRRAGYRIVYTPHAKLYHHESATFGARVQSVADQERMWLTWGDALLRDPYYNPNLSRDFPDCRLAPSVGLS
jgi:GT2 family glycosyltransferase